MNVTSPPLSLTLSNHEFKAFVQYWDNSHQKGSKVQLAKPKRLQETSETARQGCNSITSLRKTAQKT